MDIVLASKMDKEEIQVEKILSYQVYKFPLRFTKVLAYCSMLDGLLDIRVMMTRGNLMFC